MNKLKTLLLIVSLPFVLVGLFIGSVVVFRGNEETKITFLPYMVLFVGVVVVYLPLKFFHKKTRH